MVGTKLLLDAPTKNPALGYREIAAAFAEVITQSEPNFAIGIFGGWGSGKTTLMTAIKAALPKGKFVAVNFNAWRFEREPQLLIPLLDTIRAELANHPTRSSATRSKLRDITGRLGKVVRALATGLSGSVGLPGAVTVNYDTGQALTALSELSAGQDSLQPESLYVAAFSELQDSFKGLAGAGINGVVVFVDDLDRCLPSHALDVMESMKLFFDLTGFIFVVGLDEDVIDRAVSAKFGDETGGHPADGEQTSAATASLGREYAKKIFQVPYSLPAILPQELTELLNSMYGEAGIEGEQLADLHDRVGPYVNLVAVKRRVNPREVKRFINSYTLQTLIRPELDRDVVLALQVLAFRRDWEEAYNALDADSELFLGALRNFRTGYRAAFEDTVPGLRPFSADLVSFLTSPLAERLAAQSSLDAYLSSLRSTSGSGTWLFDLFHALGKVERAVAGAKDSLSQTSVDAVVEALNEYRSATDIKAPTNAIRDKIVEITFRLGELASELSAVPPERLDSATGTLQVLAEEIERFKAELRFVRDAETR